MDFMEATDRLLACNISLADLAEELDVQHGTIRRARLDPASEGYRSPPAGWRDAIVRLAQKRGGKLLGLAEELKD